MLGSDSKTDQVLSSVVGAALLVMVCGTPGFGQPATAQSLYQRMGGYDFIATFVDTAFPRLATHPRLQRLFQGHSVDSQINQRQLIVDALCKEMGGPCFYIGRPMKPLHDGLHISPADWDDFMKIIMGALDELKVAQRERQDWIPCTTRVFLPDIVEGGAGMP